MRRATRILNYISDPLGSLYRVAEQVVSVYPTGYLPFGRLRSRWHSFQTKFWGTGMPAYSGTEVNYTQARQLYRNDGDFALGAGFAKPIVDLSVGFMGIPTATTEDPTRDDFLNECLHVYWIDEIQQMFRDAIRDSKVIVRVSKPDLFDPLMTIEEQEHCTLEIISPERVQIERNAANKRIIERAIIEHRMVFVMDDGNPSEGRDPTVEEHEVIEIIDRDRIRFFDKQTNQFLTELEAPNRARLVPLVEVFNEWDSALAGGQSDLESVQPFLNALHDVIAQGLQAHKYHSTPKLKMKLSDISTFLLNNFPDAIDTATGRIKAQAEISWSGREVFLLQSNQEEDIAFIEARDVLQGTRALAEFLIDCICVASQTPEWAFMRVDSGSANSDRNAQTVPFTKKVLRKRNSFAKYVQELLKMALVLNNEIPVRAKLMWDYVRADDLLVENQAIQQLIMSLEVAKQSGEISDSTYREMIRPFMPFMKNPLQEERDALDNSQASIGGPSGGGTPALNAGPQGNNE